MPLTKDLNRDFYVGDVESYPVKANAVIFKGAAIGEDGSGYARPLVAGDKFLGFAHQEGVDNTGGADGAVTVFVRRRGCFVLPVTGLVLADNDGVPVYASADDTFVKTASGNSFVGYVRRFMSSGLGLVEFDAAQGLTPSNGIIGNATFVVGAEVANAITVNIQLKDVLGGDLAVRGAVHAYLANDANGDTIEAATAGLSLAAGSDGALVETSTDNGFLLISEADGDIDVVITDTSGANTVHLVLVMPDGRLVASPVITFAA